MFTVFQQQNGTRGKVQRLDSAQYGVPGKGAVLQRAAYKGDVWSGTDDFVRYCLGIEGTGQDGFKPWAAATPQLRSDQLRSHPGSIADQNSN